MTKDANIIDESAGQPGVMDNLANDVANESPEPEEASVQTEPTQEPRDVEDARDVGAQADERLKDAELEQIADEMDTAAKKFARWPEKRRKIFEIVGGLLIGALSGTSLTFIPSDGSSFLSISVVLALVLALVVPRILENKLKTQFKLMKRYVIIALGAYVLAMAVIAFTSGSQFLAG